MSQLGCGLQPEDLNLSSYLFQNDKDFAICVGFADVKEYDREKQAYTGKIVGTRVEVVLPEHKYAHINVIIPTEFKGLLAPNCKVRFEGLTANYYRDFRSQEYYISAKANSVVVIK